MTIRRVAVLGAGTMGAGIAQACAQAGLDVQLRDLTSDALDKAIERMRGPLEKRVAAGKTTQDEVDAIFANINTTTDMGEAVGSADLVIEAVFEDLKVKRDVFAEADRHAPEGCIFATNTSSLKVTDLAKATERPSRFGGLHFFFPANINKLLEVVAADDTSDETLQALMDFARSIGKVPIETSDSEGFCINRFFVPWVNESVRLLDEGVADVATIDAAAKQAFQIGMGPFELMNVTGVPISLHAQRTLHRAFGEFYEPAKGLVAQVEDLGEDWDLSGTPDETKFEAVGDRLMGVVFGIAAQLVDEGVCSEADTDKGAVVGLRWKQGPFAMMNAIGLERSRELVDALTEQWGDEFAVPANLAARADDGTEWPLPRARLDVDGAVATVTVQDPRTRNALSPAVLDDIRDCLERARDDDGVRVVVLTGEGSSFIAGADIKAMSAMSPKDAKAYSKQGHAVANMLATMDKPTIAAVNGYAFGGGLELAIACDIVVVVDNTQVGLPETTLGIAPGFGGSVRLPMLVGPQRAKELIFTGRRISGAEAAELGIAAAAHPRADLYPSVRALAQTMAANAPRAIAAAKHVVNAIPDEDVDGALDLERKVVGRLFETKDKDEGFAAFAERRRPEFSGE